MIPLATKVLFVCVENAGRSLMAEAFAKRLGMNAASAGTQPSSHANPLVVNAMSEAGIDISSHTPAMLTLQMINDADIVVTMGCSVDRACPKPMLAEMNKKLIDWELEDPKGKSMAEIRKIRDDIQKRVNELAEYAGRRYS